MGDIEMATPKRSRKGLKDPDTLSYLDWLEGLEEAKQAAAVKRAVYAHAKKIDAKHRMSTTKKRTYKRRRTNSYRRSGGYRRSGTDIVYPNVIGRGPYRVSGGVEFGNADSWFRGKMGGDIYSSGYFTGRGPYNVKKNSLWSGLDMGMSPPKVMNVGREAFVLRHREYISDLFSGTGTPATGFDLQKFALNPGNSNLFPFMAAIAQRFQEYEIIGMLVELKSLSSEFSTNLSLGSIFMAADYNVLGPDPSSKQQLENMEYSSSCKPSCTLVMPIECDPKNNSNTHLYIADDSDYEGGDKRLYDWCNIYIGSQGIPSETTPIAEIWISYEVALYKPILNDNNTAPESLSWILRFTNFTEGNVFGDTVGVAGNTTEFQRGLADNTIVLPPDRENTYLVILNWQGQATTTLNYPTISVGGSAEQVGLFWSSNTGNANAQGAEADPNPTGDNLVVAFLVKVFKPSVGPTYGQFTCNMGVGFHLPASPNYGDVFITTCNELVLA